MEKCWSLNNLNYNKNNFKRININKERDEYNFIKKDSFSLFNRKIFLQKLLNLIKLSQIDIISYSSKNCQTENINQNNFKKIKTNLISLTKDLNILFQNYTNKKNILEKEINNNKKTLINEIFGGNQNSINDLINFNKELFHLKILNFKIENQIELTKITNKIKIKNIKDFKKNNNMELIDDFLDIFCDNKYDLLEASELLHEDLINVRNQFKLIVQNKETQNQQLRILTLIIKRIKEEIKLKKRNNYYVNTNDIINEESKENYTQTYKYTTNYDTLENNQKSNQL